MRIKNLISLIVITMLFIGITNFMVYGKEKAGAEAESKTEATVYNDGKIDYVTSALKFNLAGSDNISDIKSLYYKIDKGDFIEYKTPFSISEEGQHTIYYYSDDNVGNQSKTIAYSVIIDNTPPEVSISYDYKLYGTKDKVYASGVVKYSIIASDSLSGVKTIEYSIDSGKYETYTNPFSVEKAGDHIIKYRAIDNVGNSSAEKTFSIFVDTEKPVVKIIPSGKFYIKDNKQYAPKNFQYQIEASDTESGVGKIIFSIDGGEYIVYESPITITKEGEHTIVAKAIDNVGNISDETKVSFVSDSTPPAIELKPLGK